MIVLRGSSVNALFADACRLVSREGEPVTPRGLTTREVLGVHLCLTEPRRRLVDVPPGTVLNPAFAVAEAVWILSGSDDPWIFDYNRALRRYADGGRLRGAYGPRLRRWGGKVDQLDRVRRLLLRDPDTRQAVVQLYDPGRDWEGYRDVPCTVGYRFFLRSGRLHMNTTMRSQDLWLGRNSIAPVSRAISLSCRRALSTLIGLTIGPDRARVVGVVSRSAATDREGEVATGVAAR